MSIEEDLDEPQELPEEIVRWQPIHRPLVQTQAGSVTAGAATGSAITGTMALGALALGALAIGALAIGTLAIGRLGVRRARFDRLEVGDLVVRRFRLLEP